MSEARAFPLRRYATANPAANAEVTATVPAGAVWELIAVTVVLAQGATQTPQPTLVVLDEGDVEVYASLGGSSAQNANVTATYTWARGLAITAGGAATRIQAPLAEGLVLPAGYKITTVTAGKGANTDYGVASLLIIER